MSPSPAFYEALTEALVAGPAPELSPEAHRRAVTASALFASEQVNALTAELRWPLKIGLAGFRALIWLSHRRGFSRLPLAQQLFRPIRTTALVAYYEAVALGAPES
jgi:hypothetical protein